MVSFSNRVQANIDEGECETVDVNNGTNRTEPRRAVWAACLPLDLLSAVGYTKSGFIQNCVESDDSRTNMVMLVQKPGKGAT